MPIVVDEVVISVEAAAPAKEGAPAPRSAPAQAAAGEGEGDRQALVNECVERVLEILARRQER